MSTVNHSVLMLVGLKFWPYRESKPLGADSGGGLWQQRNGIGYAISRCRLALSVGAFLITGRTMSPGNQ